MYKIQSFKKNVQGTDYVIGDIHGCYDEFQKVLKHLNFDTSCDRMFSVGDLIDRGADSEKCLGLCDENWFHAVRGNHEQMIIDYHKGSLRYKDAIRNGGSWYVFISKQERQEYVDIAESLPIMIEVETDRGMVGILHAEFPSSLIDWGYVKEHINQWENTCIWGRTRLKLNTVENIKNIHTVISGHTPQDNIVQLGNHLWIDLGVLWNKKFGVVNITTGEKLEVNI